jgi:hypothetical protein
VSDEDRPGDLPPDLPPEYAEAYRRAYERAYREAAGMEETAAIDRPGRSRSEPASVSRPPDPDDVDHPDEDVPPRHAVSGPLFADEPSPTPAPPAAEQDAEPTMLLGAFHTETVSAPETGVHVAPVATRERPTWLVPVLLAAAVLLLIGAAYGIGKAFSSSVSSAGSDQASSGSHTLTGKPYAGPVQGVAVRHASASCQAPAAVDAAGHPVSYQPDHVFDGDFSTAWRCNSDGVGERLTLELPPGTRVAELGLVPGYAKTDPRSGADRYAENDRITKVRWLFGNGMSVVQRFDGSAHRRDLQTMRVPVTQTDKLVIEILATTPGPRHTTAISEVRVAAPSTG